ncbi:MAG: thiamine phosphate synthase [Pseudomonadota bacterium]
MESSTHPSRVEPRLYLITPPRIDDLTVFAAALEDALAPGGVAALQLRLKSADGGPPEAANVEAAADRLAPICRRQDVAFILNDDPNLARALGADGVHVGQQDVAYSVARDLMGPDKTVGVTCHDSMHLAMGAGEAGADYVAFGAFFATETKDAPTRAPVSLLADWSMATTVPCVAIGGITPQNCAPLIEAGADYLAVSASVWRAAEGPRAVVERFNQAFGWRR